MKQSQELRLLQKQWKSSKARNITKPLPDRKYQGEIVDLKLGKSKSSQRLQVVWTFRIMTPKKFADRIHYKYSQIEQKKSMSYLKGDLKRINIKAPKNIIRLESVLEEGIGKIVNFTIRTNGQFVNTWIDGEATEEEDLEEDESEDE